MINKFFRKTELKLGNHTELEVMRHFKFLSDRNFCIERGFYPLGSCTMKYNPRVNEYAASLDGFCVLHPSQKDEDSQGSLKLIFELQEMLKEITGMDAVTLQPSAGAHGELLGMMIVKKYFEDIKEVRKKVIIPDSAHGTNPASANMCGFECIEIKSNKNGRVDLQALEAVLDKDVAAIMLTNPNTLGLWENDILEISDLMHKNGSLLYYDGANYNAIMGHTNPKVMGFDIVHLNIHKTLSTPHGGGGPGAGPVGVVEKLQKYLPVPVVEFDGKTYRRNHNLPKSVGKVSQYFGNFGVLVRAYTYILSMGKTLKDASSNAVLNANYLKECLKKFYNLPFDEPCMHEFVINSQIQKEKHGVTTLQIAKRLMDENIHPPTVYFPLIVAEAMMIEPTETEDKEVLDNFVKVMKKISDEIMQGNDFTIYPTKTPVRRVDETLAARQLDLKSNETLRI